MGRNDIWRTVLAPTALVLAFAIPGCATSTCAQLLAEAAKTENKDAGPPWSLYACSAPLTEAIRITAAYAEVELDTQAVPSDEWAGIKTLKNVPVTLALDIICLSHDLLLVHRKNGTWTVDRLVTPPTPEVRAEVREEIRTNHRTHRGRDRFVALAVSVFRRHEFIRLQAAYDTAEDDAAKDAITNRIVDLGTIGREDLEKSLRGF